MVVSNNKVSAVVKPTSKGGGGRYKYASMADIAKSFEIPKMRIARDGDREWIQWYDAELKDWLDGCTIVPIHERNLGNEAQQWGAAFSYARRYTTMMALQLVTDDDDKMEQMTPGQRSYAPAKATAEQINSLKELVGDKYGDLIAKNGGEANLTKVKADALIKAVKSRQAD